MATETTVNTYTGVEGIVTYDTAAFAYCKFDIEISREEVEVERGGKWSSLALPGKVKFKGKLSYGLVDGQLFINAFDDGTNTTSTSDESLLAATAGNGALQTIVAGLSNPSVPMSLHLKIISSDGYSAGSITVMGTDKNDVLISETIPFILQATGATTIHYYGSAVFKTITCVMIPAVLSANDSLTVYGSGQKSVTLGKPKFVTITGKLYKSATQYTEITLTNCWLSKMPMAMGSASEAVIPEQEFTVRDPDTDITLVDRYV